MSQPLDLMQFPLRGSRLIEASAGTGKTFTLALLYTRLILGHGTAATSACRPLTPREILVVTFTEAATQELRERIRRRLVEAAECFQAKEEEPTGGADPLRDLRASYPLEQWPACAYRLRLAAESMDEAVISTIHAWCNRMLLEHAFDTRGVFNRELVTDQTELLTEVVRDYWRVHFYPLETSRAEAVLEVWPSPALLQKKLKPLLDRRAAGVSYKGVKLDPISLEQQLGVHIAWRTRLRELEQLEDQARALWLKHWQEIEVQLWDLRPHLNGSKHASANEEKFAVELSSLRRWAEGGETHGKLGNYAQGAFHFKKTAKVQQETRHVAFQALASRFELEAEQADDYAEPEPPLGSCILAHAADWVGHELSRRLNQRAEMGFEDLLTQLECALDPARSGAHASHLASALRREFPVALIDEFQDTDPIQYSIFDRIYCVQKNDTDTALIMIGDPKQAIYSFRGADIHTYLAAREATRGRHYTLTRNYRSTEGVVNACNRLFTFADQHDRGAFRFKQDGLNPLPFEAVQAKGRSETLYLLEQAAPAMNCWTLATEAPISKGEYGSRAAEIAAAQITRWLQSARNRQSGFGQDGRIESPLRPADIAILVRTGAEAAMMQEALTAHRVNSVYLSDRDSVFATQEACDLLHWLRACSSPGDERLIKAALGTNTIAIPLSKLADLQQNELLWEQLTQQFHDFRRIWRRQGVLAMLRQVLDDFDLPARLLQSDGGERSITNLLHLAEWLQQAATSLDGEQALIRHLAEHLDKTQEEHILRLESDDALVKVVTIHKSKGLEYPLVMLPFICSWREIDGKTTPVPYRSEGELLFEDSSKALFRDAWTRADDERLSEDMRLLYVAVTRACHALYMTVAGVKAGQSRKPQLERSAFGYVLRGGESFGSVEDVMNALAALRSDSVDLKIGAGPTPSTTKFPPDNPHDLEPARQVHGIQLKPWWIASYSALSYGARGDANITIEGSESRQSGADSLPSPDTPLEAQAMEESEAPAPGGVTAARAPDGHGLLHELPRGSYYGTFLHGILEWAAVQRYRDNQGNILRGFAAAAASPELRLDMLKRRCDLRGLSGWSEPLSRWLQAFLTTPWQLDELAEENGQIPQPVLAELSPRQIQVEMEFWFGCDAVDTRELDQLVTRYTLEGEARPMVEDNALNGMFKGFIDLVMEHRGRYFVVDWKSNWLGDGDEAYHRVAMRDAILKKRYDLQYVLYLLALHRQLRARVPDYDYEHHIGGAVYVFLRGSGNASQGLFMDKPPLTLIEQLDALFSGRSRPVLNEPAGQKARLFGA